MAIFHLLISHMTNTIFFIFKKKKCKFVSFLIQVFLNKFFTYIIEFKMQRNKIRAGKEKKKCQCCAIFNLTETINVPMVTSF